MPIIQKDYIENVVFAVTTCGMFCESESKLVSQDKKVSVNYPAASWRGINLPTQQAAGY